MDCRITTKTLKINKQKNIGTVVIVVEGENDEFRLLKHLFTSVLDYNYISIKRGKIIQHEFQSKTNINNTIIVANTSNSNIKSIIDDDEYKDKLYNLLKKEYDGNLKNVPIYIIWDRDKDDEEDDITQEHYQQAVQTFYSAMDNDYEMNGLLLLSYPCHESYILSNFIKRYYNHTYQTSKSCKKDFHKSKYTIKDITAESMLLAIENMHKTLLKYGINDYDASNLKHVNYTVYRKEEESYRDKSSFDALSLIAIMFIDLGIIYEE